MLTLKYPIKMPFWTNNLLNFVFIKHSYLICLKQWLINVIFELISIDIADVTNNKQI